MLDCTPFVAPNNFVVPPSGDRPPSDCPRYVPVGGVPLGHASVHPRAKDPPTPMGESFQALPRGRRPPARRVPSVPALAFADPCCFATDRYLPAYFTFRRYGCQIGRASRSPRCQMAPERGRITMWVVKHRLPRLSPDSGAPSTRPVSPSSTRAAHDRAIRSTTWGASRWARHSECASRTAEG